MLIKEKQGNLSTVPINNRDIDWLCIEWYEAKKRLMHKQTSSGLTVSTKFLQDNPDLKEGDILWMDEKTVIVIEIKTCKCIVITPGNIMNASAVCYEIGNKHLPLFYEGQDLLVPYDEPLYHLLKRSFTVSVQDRKLINALKTSVLPHISTRNNIFNDLQITTPS